jgi:hypothetical protein
MPGTEPRKRYQLQPPQQQLAAMAAGPVPLRGWRGRLRSINLEAPADRHPIPNRLPTGMRDHSKPNLDRLLANSRDVGHQPC